MPTAVPQAAYRARRPAETPLYALLESLCETVKGAWEDLFERRYGFWRGLLDGVVADVGHAQWWCSRWCSRCARARFDHLPRRR